MKKKIIIEKNKKDMSNKLEELFVGDSVSTADYGLGVIVEIDENGICHIKLENGETRHFTKKELDK